jgi:agmatine deiminase
MDPWTRALLCGLTVTAIAFPGTTTLGQDTGDRPWDEALRGPLPRWRAGGPPPEDPNQSRTPYALHLDGALGGPTSGLIESPAEYAPMNGVLFRYSTFAWDDVVTDCVAALTGDPAHDEIAYVVVSSISQQNAATSQFAAAGADLGKVQFFIMPTDSIWIRDYGPHFIRQSSAPAIADSHYYPGRPLDNFVPTRLGDDALLQPTYDMGLYYSGGNFQPGPNRSGFTTSLVHLDNPDFGDASIGQLYQQFQGIDTLHIMPKLPFSVDGTGHIDMWMYLIDDDTVIISRFLPGSNSDAITITENAVIYMEQLGFEVFRVPAHNGWHPYDSGCHFTYTNAYRVNDRIFVPTYGGTHASRDMEALWAFQAAAPDCQIIPIDSYGIIYAAGAIHCIIMQVPGHTDPAPAAHVVAPDGGELLVSGAVYDLQWSAIDDVTVSSVDLRYSLDGGATFPHLIAARESNDGHFDWTAPDDITLAALVQVTAVDGDGNSIDAVSETPFEIARAPQRVYDFSSGAGVDKWAWGYRTSHWSMLAGVRHPAQADDEIDTLQSGAYARIATSNASGSDSDSNRYIAPGPGSGYETTHVFEFTIEEDPTTILDVEFLWEGYGDACVQMEMYVWDDVQLDWCDGVNAFGENRYIDNFASNRDQTLGGHIRSDFDRFIDGDGRLTLLVYGERSSQEAFHDYVAVVVTHRLPGDTDGNGTVDVSDLIQVITEWGPCPPPPTACPSDTNGDGAVDVQDLVQVIMDWH